MEIPQFTDKYLYFPSHSKSPYFTTNVASEFKIELPVELRVTPGQYEIALAQLNIKKSWENISRDIHFFWATTEEGNFKWSPNPIIIKSGVYSNIDEVLATINRQAPKAKTVTKFKFTYDTDINRVIFTRDRRFAGDKQVSQVLLAEELARILGYEILTLRDDRVVATKPPDLSDNIDHIFVYSNLVEKQIVGDEFVTILRMTHAPKNIKYGDIIEQEYSNRQYLPMDGRNVFNFAAFSITDQFGRPIPFSGKDDVLVVVHIRRIGLTT